MVKIRRPVVLSVIIMASMLFTGCKSSLYEKHKSEYTPVTAVEAAEFEVLTSLSSKATAISNIADSETYDGLYIYKDGSTKYVLFDTTSIVIAVGPTEFGFPGNESEETLEAHSVENVWMKGIDGEFEYDKSASGNAYKIMAEVDAQYALTPTQYCTLHGIMASVSNGEIEYSIFAGAVGDKMTKDQQKIVEHTVKSFRLKEGVSNTPEESRDVEPAAKETTANIQEEQPAEEEVIKDVEPEDTAEVAEENTKDASEEGKTEEQATTGAESKTKDKPEEDAATEKTITSVESDENETQTETETPEETKEDPKPEAAVPEGYRVDPKQSTAFTPLKVGEWGVGSVMKADYSMDFTAVYIDNIYTGEDATKLIKDNSGRKTTPKEGTSFVVVEYTTDVSSKEGYLDIRFCGVDGEKLVQRGISYTQRTYDMLDGEKESKDAHNLTTYTKRYAYYEVPTGCKEYLLSFGYRIPGLEDQLEAANYLIKTK